MGEIPRRADVLRRDLRAADRLSRRLLAGRRVAVLRPRRMAAGLFDPSNFGALASRYIGFMTNEVLVAVPLFIFMGVMLERSGIAEALLLTMGKVFGKMRGGLGLSVILVGRAAGGLDRRGRRHRGHHGPHQPAGHAAGRLRPEARLRRHLRLRHAGPDHPALDRPDLHGRHAGRASMPRCRWPRATSRPSRYRWATSSSAPSCPAWCWSCSTCCT